MKKVVVIGVASGIGANNSGCCYAPVSVKKALTTNSELDLAWHTILHRRPNRSKMAEIRDLQERIIRQIVPVVSRGAQFIVIDGDHSSAMGVWQGTMEALHPNRRFGLLWIDAHPDLHTFSTSHERVHDNRCAHVQVIRWTWSHRSINGFGPASLPVGLLLKAYA